MSALITSSCFFFVSCFFPLRHHPARDPAAVDWLEFNQLPSASESHCFVDQSHTSIDQPNCSIDGIIPVLSSVHQFLGRGLNPTIPLSAGLGDVQPAVRGRLGSSYSQQWFISTLRVSEGDASSQSCTFTSQC